MFTFIDLINDFPLIAKQYIKGIKTHKGSVDTYKTKGKRVFYISPANSKGFMDGGIDRVYSLVMFPGVEKLVKQAYVKHGKLNLMGCPYLPIGSAVVVPVTSAQPDVPAFLISAPTMWMPHNVSKTNNAYYAMLAILHVLHHNGYSKDDEVVIPPLCCGYGQMSKDTSVQQIKRAINDFEQLIHDGKDIPGNKDMYMCEPAQSVDEQPLYYENSEFKKIPPSHVVHH